MAEDVLSFLFGESLWGDEPRFQFDATVAKEVNHAALSFLHSTIGLSGTFHDQHGWMVDMDAWSALRQYIQWCIDGQMDFLWHAHQVSIDDEFYMALATRRMRSFLDKAADVK